MAFPSLFPVFMNPLSQGGGFSGDNLVVALLAEPEINLEPEISVQVETDTVSVTVEPEIEIEVE